MIVNNNNLNGWYHNHNNVKLFQMNVGVPAVIYSPFKLENINEIIQSSWNQGGLYIGDAIALKKPQLLAKYNIAAVLNCANQTCEHQPKNIEFFKYIPAKDSLNYDMSQHFEEAYMFIDMHMKNKKNVLVNCFAGVSRSATLIVAFLIKKWKWSLQKSLQYVISRRSRVKPNQHFLRQLKLYEEKQIKSQNNIENVEIIKKISKQMNNSENKKFNNISEFLYQSKKEENPEIMSSSLKFSFSGFKKSHIEKQGYEHSQYSLNLDKNKQKIKPTYFFGFNTTKEEFSTLEGSRPRRLTQTTLIRSSRNSHRQKLSLTQYDNNMHFLIKNKVHKVHDSQKNIFC